MANQFFTASRTTQTGTVAAASNGTGISIKNCKGYGIAIETTVATAAAKTFTTGALETGTITCVADAGRKRKTTFTAVADVGVLEIQTLTFQAKAGTASADYIVVEDTLGGKWAVFADLTGADAAPIGAIYTAIPGANKTSANITASVGAPDVAAVFKTSFEGLTGFTAKITIVDNLDGTLSLTQTKVGPVTNPVPKTFDDGGAGSIAGIQSTGGVASNLNNSYFTVKSALNAITYIPWFNVNGEGVEPVVAGTKVPIAITLGAQADTDVGGAVRTAFTGHVSFNLTGATNQFILEVKLLGVTDLPVDGAVPTGFTIAETVIGAASNLQSSYVTIYSSPDEGLTEVRNTIWLNVAGEGSAPVIAGDVLSEVTITYGSQADTDVATAIDGVINALSDLDSTVLNAVVTVTAADVGVVTDMANGAVSPGFTIATTLQGTENTFSIANNTITLTAHPYFVGLKVAATTTGSLPTGLAATDYYVIVVDANTIKLATTAANALLGTAVNITGNGSGTHTLTPAAIGGASYKLQGALEESDGSVGEYADLSITNSVTATANFIHSVVDPMYDYVRVVWAMTAGQILYTLNLNTKEESN